MNRSPLIVALDVSTREKAISLVKELGSSVSIYKIGSVLFTKYGPSIVREIKDTGKDIFLDLKLYDIPNTVASTVKVIADIGIYMFTVHISGGMEMLTAAVKAVRDTASRKPPKILGVTILTSVKDASLADILKMVKIAKDAGLDGVISSPLEVKDIRKALGADFLIVTPGIRPVDANVNDQKRIATPKTAIQSGADYIVVGRPIVESDRPAEVVKNILSEISFLK